MVAIASQSFGFLIFAASEHTTHQDLTTQSSKHTTHQDLRLCNRDVLCVFTNAYVHARTHTHTHTHACMYALLFALITYTHTHIHTYRCADFDAVYVGPGWAQQPLGALKQPPLTHTHTHTHTDIYIYIYIYVQVCRL